ncbi:MAG: hypothetical protein ABSD49_11060, partial [Candidatus Bathyarchaeia archaeon]
NPPDGQIGSFPSHTRIPGFPPVLRSIAPAATPTATTPVPSSVSAEFSAARNQSTEHVKRKALANRLT